MRTRLLASVIGAGLLAASGLAWPQGATHFYAGGAIGEAKAKDACPGAPGGASCDDRDTAWKILGGYQLNRNFALELGYDDFGSAKAWELALIDAWPVSNRFGVYGKLGAYHGEMKAGAAKGTSTDFTFGLGASYELTDNVAFRLEWQRFNDVGGSDAGRPDIDALSIGALYRF